MGRDNISLTRKSNLCVKAKQKKEFIHCCPLAGKHSATSWKAGPQRAWWLLRKIKRCNHRHPSSPSFSPSFCWRSGHRMYGISLWSAVPAMSSPSFFPIPGPGGRMRKAEDLDTAQAPFSNGLQTGVLPTALVTDPQHSNQQQVDLQTWGILHHERMICQSEVS